MLWHGLIESTPRSPQGLSVYEGELVGGKPHGKGKMISPDFN